jgi:phosphatidylethanolamine-binding protein (PEBP) family uncharacterized protein
MIKILYDDIEIINGKFMLQQNTKNQPQINFTNNMKKDVFYTLIMYDPNAISGNYLHWLIINITDNDINDGEIILKYRKPTPPLGTGIHNYIFLLFEQNNKINIDNLKNIDRIISLNKLYELFNVKLYLVSKKYFISQNI